MDVYDWYAFPLSVMLNLLFYHHLLFLGDIFKLTVEIAFQQQTKKSH